MPRNASEILVDTLVEWGRKMVFGLPGDVHPLNGLYDAKLDRTPVPAITGLQCDLRDVPAAREDPGDEERRPRPDQAGADDVPRQHPGVLTVRHAA
ncbi:hypothetical protein [Azospirillum rugosum]|uniref:Thiamine pyrophosphate enzyme, N-terminal TPP binding domain n=1 Tax=Azospirillum rugosum TaxID=416170 RepID=A0ABS4SUL0_9PROT|nr:hypothetical protein [Azospirillum rugosum]MBP2296240.1 hypothetical protein [Azospirillum rugosum]MDQ0529761.1 hypothetical protein [Azospirillum rugosum]